MGSKGSNTTTTNQSQTYNPAGSPYITNALNQAQNAAQLPFNIPQAPVAGFQPLQNQAFNQISQGANFAQPFYQQAGSLFGQAAQAPDVGAFYNPMAQNVTNQLQNIFGQQNVQNTGSLTQAAGGVGADRIAVGQANLANQQGLAAGQTYANLWQQAQQAAQAQQQAQMQAASGLGNVGQGMQNAALSGGNALLGAGGLQQQLAQAQLNSPYQLALAQAAFPYQQSQFLSGAVGALAPGLGGTTTGYGQTTAPAPSLFSQILGAGTAGAGLAGQFGLFGGSPSYGGGNAFTDAYGGSGSSPLPGLTAADYGAGYAGGGGVSDQPIDVAPASIFPTGSIPHISANIPHLNLNVAAPSQQSGGGMGDLIKGATTLASLFAARGGAIPSYADGGATFDERWNAMTDGGDEPFRMPDQAAVDDWRRGTPLPPSAAPASPRAAAPAPVAPVADDAEVPEGAQATAAAGTPSPPVAPASDSGGFDNFIKSPWAALTAAGLGIMGGTSPFAGVNIGQGAMQGLKMLQTQRESGQKDETIAQASERLKQEAQEHLDAQTKMTPYQQAQVDIKEAEAADEGVIDDDTARHYGKIFAATGQMPPLGYGKTASKNRAKIAAAAMQEGTPEEAVANRVEFGANKAGAQTAARQQAGIDRAVIEAQRTFPLAEQASAAVPRGKWVPLNKLALAIKSGTSDPALAAFYVANQGAISAYASAMGRGSPVTTVHAQTHAEELLKTASSHEAYVAALRQMDKEMAAARGAPVQVRQDIRGQITGHGAAPTAAAPSFTGRTASGPGGAKLRETSDGQWVP